MEPINNCPRIFNKPIPDDLFLAFFAELGVYGFYDSHFFPVKIMNDVVCAKLHSLLHKLKSYYHKHKLFLIEREMTPMRYITVLRQMSRSRGFVLEGKEYVEKMQGNPKKMMYRLICGGLAKPSQLDEKAFCVAFD